MIKKVLHIAIGCLLLRAFPLEAHVGFQHFVTINTEINNFNAENNILFVDKSETAVVSNVEFWNNNKINNNSSIKDPVCSSIKDPVCSFIKEPVFSTFKLNLSDTSSSVPPIDTVFIKVQRSDFAAVGRFKSVMSNELQTGLLHERLTENATFFKQYGVSGSSTVSKRGADATQTQVVWNGLPINHPMLGMTDFNGISSFAFSEIFLIEGGNSALFGSGSVGGTIFLNNQSQFESPFKVSLLLQSNSLNNHRVGLDIKNSWNLKENKRLFVQATLSSVYDQNQFQFDDRLSGQSELQLRNNINSDLNNRSGRVVFAFKSSKSMQWKWVTEQTNVFRELGTLYGSTKFIGAQWDQNTRSILEIKKGFDRCGITQKLGYTRDHIVFQDEMNIPQNSENRDTSVATMQFAQTELYYNQSILGDFIVGFDVQNQVGKSPYFGGKELINTKQSRLLPAQFLGWKKKWSKMEWLSNFRFEWLEKVATYGVSAEYQIFKQQKLRFDAHSHFRRPTLNDLFWYSPDALADGVKSETGWATEIGWNVESLKNNQNNQALKYRFQSALYYRELNNPIIWTPTGAFWSARNFHFGKYYGIQSEGRLSKSWKLKSDRPFSGWLTCQFDVVNAQVKRSVESEYFFQIFIPDVMGNIELGIATGAHRFSIKGSHTGNRYIQTDNQNWLPGYRLISVDYQWRTEFFKQPVLVGFALQNATNTVYQNMPGRPMPPRFVGASFHYQFAKHNSK